MAMFIVKVMLINIIYAGLTKPGGVDDIFALVSMKSLKF